MPARWTPSEEKIFFNELHRLYVVENKTIREVGALLGLAEQTVFQRLQRLGIPSSPERKQTYAARLRDDIVIPRRKTPQLAEFMGIMLGDGRVAPYQIIVTLGTKEVEYVHYVACLMQTLFGVMPSIAIRNTGYRDVYIGSKTLVGWFLHAGFTHNKVRAQIAAPRWLFIRNDYLQSFLRGFFDTDGSVYRLRFGIQISFTNHSLPLLRDIHDALVRLKYHPSSISHFHIYLTKRSDVIRFFEEIGPANAKHVKRFSNIKNVMGR